MNCLICVFHSVVRYERQNPFRIKNLKLSRGIWKSCVYMQSAFYTDFSSCFFPGKTFSNLSWLLCSIAWAWILRLLWGQRCWCTIVDRPVCVVFFSRIKLFLDVLMKEVLHPESQSPNGVKFHFIDIYLDELSKVGGKEVRNSPTPASSVVRPQPTWTGLWLLFRCSMS